MLGRRSQKCLNFNGYRQVLGGIAEGAKEDKAGWGGFLKHMRKRGLQGVDLFISDACMGLIESLGEYYRETQWQRCTVHLYRNVFSLVPRGKVQGIAHMLKAIHAQEDAKAAHEKAQQVCAELRAMKLGKAADWVEQKVIVRYKLMQ